MTFEQHYGDRPPDGSTDVVGYEVLRRWEDRKAVWIKAQLEEREACALACESIGKEIVCPEECSAAIRARRTP